MGKEIKQGYITPLLSAKQLEVFGFRIDWVPNVNRLRKYGDKYIFTIKGKGSRECEVVITKQLFDSLWPRTNHHRVFKKRLITKIKGVPFEVDAFTDRFLLIAEREVKVKLWINDVPKIGKDITKNQFYKNKNLAK